MATKRKRSRRAAVMTETVIVFSVFLLLILGMLELGIMLFRHHVLSAAVRHGARRAIVHGSYAAPLPSWGPDTIGPVSATDPNSLVQAIRSRLIGVDPGDVTVHAVWLDGSNEPGNRVQITVSSPYQPGLSFLFGSQSRTLRATSTMTITH